jgi:hypothetical protein
MKDGFQTWEQLSNKHYFMPSHFLIDRHAPAPHAPPTPTTHSRTAAHIIIISIVIVIKIVYSDLARSDSTCASSNHHTLAHAATTMIVLQPRTEPQQT